MRVYIFSPSKDLLAFHVGKHSFNYAPSSTEASLLSEWIEEAESEHGRYTGEIDRLRSIMKKLERERAYLQRYIDEYRTLLSPIRKLPPEILTEIFSLHCQAPSWLRRPVIAPPMIIAQTCSFWRQLALDTPLLWASFHVTLSPFPGNIQLLSTYLHRSKDLPLTVELDYREPNDCLVLKTLLEHSWRWKRFLLYGADRLSSIESPLILPLLKSLELSTITSSRVTSIFKNALALKRLTLDNVSVHTIELETLPCSRLTSVTVRRLSVSDALHVLHNCPNVEKVTISTRNFTHWLHGAVHFDQPVRLSSLTTLTFTTELFCPLFRNLITPSLTTLTVAAPTEPYDMEVWPQSEFVAFLQRSACPLRYLSLVNIELSDADLLSIFQHTPLLTHLSVKENPRPDLPGLITNRVLRRLTFPKTSANTQYPPLPHLQFIDFVTHPSRIDYGLMIDLLSSRSSPLAKRHGFSVLKDVSARQGFINASESEVPHHVIPRVDVPLMPLIDGITNRIFALGGSIVTPVFSSIRLIIPIA
ncbi:hypothetical protein E1B28_011583 [Marasmius oreades]|uniref:F-box domain-containing protein n=1 Tax=Marasmius oreades TaxID=181124 RepID=A0A9P7UQ43_9AGAR|nr:uncharacterized protein E1B28_011583 [Marasmius oreades]KAG7089958.1 hypothetical protein E1B28_011583 [Marasmius oreades]